MVVDYILLALFLLWAAISIVGQFRNSFSQNLRRWDYCGLIPTWTFFAPNPISADHFLYYRDHLASGITPWQRAFFYEPSSFLCSIWGPRRKEEKTISDTLFNILDLTAVAPQERIYLTTAYLIVLSFISSLPHNDEAIATQFMFARKREGRPIQPLFVSDIHRI